MGSIGPIKTSKLDLDNIRKRFPALSQGRIWFDNAAGSFVLGDAVDATASFMAAVNAPPLFSDQESLKVTEEWDAELEERAAFMNASADEVAFGASTTQLLHNLALSLLPNMNSDSEMIVSNLCHEAGISAWVFLARRLGITIKWWSPGQGNSPTLDLEKLRELLSPKTRLVTCNHVSNIVGTIHPIKAIADIVHTVPGAMLSVDGVAYAPHRRIDVKALDVDFYCFSWYKVFGPHIGMIYARRSVQDRDMTSLGHYWLDHRPLETKLGLGTECFELQHGLTRIMRYLKEIQWEKIVAHEQELTEVLLAYLRSKPETYVVYGEASSDPNLRVSLVTFSVKGWSSECFATEVMNRSKVRITSGNCYSKRPTEQVLGLGVEGAVRVSFVHYNTVEEIEVFKSVLDDVICDKNIHVNGESGAAIEPDKLSQLLKAGDIGI